jgi:ferric-dicitrate binding protein FerR (iron transport regulator)
MSVPRHAVLAARLLRGSVPAEGNGEADRARSLATIDRALSDLERRRRRLRAFGFVAAAAAAAACALAWVGLEGLHRAPPMLAAPAVAVVASPVADGARVLDSHGEGPLGPGVALQVGGRIATASGGGARLELSTGTSLELESASILSIQHQDTLQRFALAQGAVNAKVAKLGSGERFLIDTPDAQIEVRGTAFRLQVLAAAEACGDGTRTRLQVREGVVEVRAGNRLARVAAGELWPPTCGVAAVTPVASGPVPGATPADAGKGPRRTGQPSVLRATSSSSLVVQNDLFERGVRAERQGDVEAALQAYAELLARHPSSPLAENALAGRMRLLGARDAAQARREAVRYLERYPKGFARLEAERLVAGH